MGDEKGREWFHPEELLKAQHEDAAKVDQGLDVSKSDFGAYHALWKYGNRRWIRGHGIGLDPAAAASYAGQVATVLKAVGLNCTHPKILDMGCGPGAVAFAFYEQFQAESVLGVDVSDAAVQFAKAHYGPCRFMARGIDGKTQFGERFDLIHALEFYPFTRTSDIATHTAYLKMAAGHLKPGGAIVIGLRETEVSLAANVGKLRGALKDMGLSEFSRTLLCADRPYRWLPLRAARFATGLIKKVLGIQGSAFLISRSLSNKEVRPQA